MNSILGFSLMESHHQNNSGPSTFSFYSGWMMNILKPYCICHFIRIFMNKQVWIFIRISLKFISYGPIYNKSAMVQTMGLLPDTQNCGLRMRWECREWFPRHRLQRKLLVNDPGMHHDTCVTHVPWCMSGSLTSGGGENVPGIPSACATHSFAYLVRGPWLGGEQAVHHYLNQCWSNLLTHIYVTQPRNVLTL